MARKAKSDSPSYPSCYGILPLAAHLDLVDSTSLEQFSLDPRTVPKDGSQLDEMKSHIVDFYDGVEAVHSFEDAAGAVFDCVPLEQQPSLRGYEGPLPTPPDLTPVLRGEEPSTDRPEIGQRERAAIPEPPRDRHGNAMEAPPGSVPIRRITLAGVGRFATLADFMRKEGGPTTTKPSAPDADTGKNHRYAYTHQTVDNIGGHSAFALYNPAIDANQVFSLCQHWYTGGSGANHQTVEVGWQVYPQLYGHANPVFFIYWTADNYGATGAYNLTAPGFVQWGTSAAVGAAQTPVSVTGGTQMELDVAVYLFQGNWWIYYGGITPSDAMGYYPVSLFGAGQMATSAEEILFGGETVCRSVAWPSMGSGGFASTGWQQAAYHRAVYYYPPGGGSTWSTLTTENPSPNCYSADAGWDPPPSAWGVYFFYGGPGGGDC